MEPSIFGVSGFPQILALNPDIVRFDKLPGRSGKPNSGTPITLPSPLVHLELLLKETLAEVPDGEGKQFDVIGCLDQEVGWPFLFKGLIIGSRSYFGCAGRRR
jgi:hypothetical protein